MDDKTPAVPHPPPQGLVEVAAGVVGYDIRPDVRRPVTSVSAVVAMGLLGLGTVAEMVPVGPETRPANGQAVVGLLAARRVTPVVAVAVAGTRLRDTEKLPPPAPYCLEEKWPLVDPADRDVKDDRPRPWDSKR